MEIVVRLSRGVNVSVFVHLSLSVVPNLAAFGSNFPEASEVHTTEKHVYVLVLSETNIFIMFP